MKKEYDFSNARPNPYAKKLKSQITVKPHTTKVACFRGFSPRISFPPYSGNSAFGSLRSQSRIQANKRG